MGQEKPSDYSADMTPLKGKEKVREGSGRASDGSADWTVVASPTSRSGAKIVCWRIPTLDRNGQALYSCPAGLLGGRREELPRKGMTLA